MSRDQPLTDEQFDRLLLEPDAFKLAIRGLTAIEADLDSAIAEAFGGEVPGEIRSSRFGIRLALGVGLRIIPPDTKGLFERLSNLRNDFAHGRIDDLTRQRARPLAGEIIAAVGGDPRSEFPQAMQKLASLPPRASLAIALRTARQIIRIVANARRQRDDKEKQIIDLHRAFGGSALTQALAMAAQGEAKSDEPLGDA